MKNRLFTILLLYSLVFNLQAQKSIVLTMEKNGYQADNELVKQQVVFRDPGSQGKNLTWDFMHLQTIHDEYRLHYFIPDSTNMQHICGMEHRTRYYYRQTPDSLWAKGFENYTTLMNYTTPELKLKFPFSYGDTLVSDFEGEGMYSNMLNLYVKGYTKTKADAEGLLKLPDLQGRALRIHTKRHYTQVKTEDNPYLLLETDSITKNDGDTLRMTLDTYSWYLDGSRYPVFESIKSTLHQLGKEQTDTTVFCTSFFYTPREETEPSTDPDIPEIETVFTEASFAPNPVVNLLHIHYKLTRVARIHFRLHSNNGIIMWQTSSKEQSEGYHQTQIPMSALPTGSYTLYIHVDDMMMSRVVVKK